MASPDPLKVIALISGGKDSIYSLLHILSAGHTIIALANLYPPAPPHVTIPSGSSTQNNQATQTSSSSSSSSNAPDLNSFMYQTVGHTLIPHLSTILSLPLYRAPITGSSSHGQSYTPPAPGASDETESLTALLKQIQAAHPDANAVCTGAILSTYQRIRVESVCARLRLVSLAPLWQYPSFYRRPAALLAHMEEVGVEARIVKVASGGLGEEDLWVDVVGEKGRERVGRKIRRFVGESRGGEVLGEGGEFETFVVDVKGWEGWRGRVEVEEKKRRVVREEGGVAWLACGEARVIWRVNDDKRKEVAKRPEVRIPELLEEGFCACLEAVKEVGKQCDIPAFQDLHLDEALLGGETGRIFSHDGPWKTFAPPSSGNWTISPRAQRDSTPEMQMSDVITQIQQLLDEQNLEIGDIQHTTLLLRNMVDFGGVNKAYTPLFPHPLPPSRATLAIGPILPSGLELIMHLTLSPSSTRDRRRGLHVQSRSYWAPANIGPYSQAKAFPLWEPRIISAPIQSHKDGDCSEDEDSRDDTSAPIGVSIAGQIALVPSTGELVQPADYRSNPSDSFALQTTLSLQHLFRIARAMSASYFLGTAAYIPHSSSPAETSKRAKVIGAAWRHMHRQPRDDNEGGSEDDDDAMDLWETRHRHGQETIGGAVVEQGFPDWDLMRVKGTESQFSVGVPPVWVAEVESLPRGAEVEWVPTLGVCGAEVVWDVQEVDGGRVVRSAVAGKGVWRVVLLDYDSKEETWEELLGLERTGREKQMMWLDVGVERLWDGRTCEGVVPVRSLCDEEGKRLAAVMVVKEIL